MKRHTLLLALCVCLLMLTSARAALAKDTWTSVRTKNFQLLGNASEKDIRQVATRLEQFRFVFTQLFPKAKFNSPVPTTVIVFKNDGAYKPYKPLYNGKPASVAAYFQPGPDMNYITLTSERYGEESPYAPIFHEYVHLLIENTLSDVPLWFNEGLAEYYSTFDITEGDRKVLLGKIVSNHVLRLREQFIPLRDLLLVDHRSPLYNERDKQSVFYAQSWAFLHYLLQDKDGAHKKQLARFSDLVIAGRPLEESFQQAFQTDFKTMERELRNYVNKNAYTATFAMFEKPLVFDAEMQASTMTEAEAEAALGDLLLHINRLDVAETHLQQALALAPDLATAHASLGMLRVRQHRLGDAKESLKKAVAANSQNYLAHYYYAYALSREGMDQNNFTRGYAPELAATMRAELQKAIALAPQYAESYYLLGFVNLVTGEQLTETAPLLMKAQALIPGRHDFAFVLAQVYLRTEQYDAARRVLTGLANGSGADAQLRAQAQSMLANLAMMEEQTKRLKEQGYEVVREPGGNSNDSSAPPRLKRREQADETSAPDKPDSRFEVVKITVPKHAGGTPVRGNLLRIDCSGAAQAVFQVKVGDRVLKLHAKGFDGVEFVSFVATLKGEISCGVRQNAELVIVTYRPAAPANGKAREQFDGEVIAVDFITPEMDIEP